MPKRHVNPPSLFPSVELGFSQAIIASGSRVVFLSGQTAWDAHKQIVGATVGEQARQALRNVRSAVEAAGGALSDIVSMRIYAVQPSRDDLAAVGGAVRDAFGKHTPASTWIGVWSLAVPDFLIEIEAIAVLEK